MAGCAEAAARYERDTCFLENKADQCAIIGESRLRSRQQRLNLGEQIEGAARIDDGDAFDIAQALANDAPSNIEPSPERLNYRLITVERGDARRLGHRARVGRRLRTDDDHGIDEGLGTDPVADPPSGHRIGFRHTIYP